MEYLLDHGTDIHGLTNGFTGPSEARRAGRKGTPLHEAAKWGNKEAMKWLVEHGADPEARNERGKTPAEWGRKYDADGPNRTVRIRRAILRKNAKKREEDEEREKKMQNDGVEAEKA